MFDQLLQAKIVDFFRIHKAKTEAKEEFFELLENYLQTSILDFILSKLDKKNGQTFLSLTEEDTDGKVSFSFAQKLIPNLEMEIEELLKEKIREITK